MVASVSSISDTKYSSSESESEMSITEVEVMVALLVMGDSSLDCDITLWIFYVQMDILVVFRLYLELE